MFTFEEKLNMEKVAHLGGVFIYSENPKELAEWYNKNLGIEYLYTDEYKAYYSSFYYTDIQSGKKASTAWSILSSKDRPKTDKKLYCINYRINDLEKMVEQLRKNSIAVKGPETYDEGKFAWMEDPEGNYIELWEDTQLK